jgi:hypothetical protein
MPALRYRFAAAGLALALASCGGENFSPTVDNVAGSYTASTFTITTTAGTVNLLAVGAIAAITLADDGTTTGQLFVPGGADNGGDLDADLAGTWTLDGSTVTFDQAANTFLPVVDFAASRNRLTAEDTFGGQTIRLVLAKSDLAPS